jgi:hypothetical protein
MRTALHKLQKERDVMHGLLEDADMLDEVQIEENEPEAEEDDDLQQSLIQMKEREIERNMSQKYSAMMKAQRDSLEAHQEWEIDCLKRQMKEDISWFPVAISFDSAPILCPFHLSRSESFLFKESAFKKLHHSNFNARFRNSSGLFSQFADRQTDGYHSKWK